MADIFEQLREALLGKTAFLLWAFIILAVAYLIARRIRANRQAAAEAGGPANYVSPRTVAIYGVLTALAAAVTYASYLPFSPTKGYFNIGDSMVFFSALTFGWRAGSICGGIGSAAADILLGSGIYAPITLVAKGAEGLVSGRLGRMGNRWVTIIGIAAGGSCMIAGYFLGEYFLLDVGFGKALAEVPINVVQAAFGGTIGLLLSAAVKRSYPKLNTD